MHPLSFALFSISSERSKGPPVILSQGIDPVLVNDPEFLDHDSLLQGKNRFRFGFLFLPLLLNFFFARFQSLVNPGSYFQCHVLPFQVCQMPSGVDNAPLLLLSDLFCLHFNRSFPEPFSTVRLLLAMPFDKLAMVLFVDPNPVVRM